MKYILILLLFIIGCTNPNIKVSKGTVTCRVPCTIGD